MIKSKKLHVISDNPGEVQYSTTKNPNRTISFHKANLSIQTTKFEVEGDNSHFPLGILRYHEIHNTSINLIAKTLYTVPRILSRR